MKCVVCRGLFDCEKLTKLKFYFQVLDPIVILLHHSIQNIAVDNYLLLLLESTLY